MLREIRQGRRERPAWRRPLLILRDGHSTSTFEGLTMLAFVKDAGYRIGEFEFNAGWLTNAEKSTRDVLATHYGDVAHTPEKLSDEIDLSHLRADVLRTFPGIASASETIKDLLETRYSALILKKRPGRPGPGPAAPHPVPAVPGAGLAHADRQGQSPDHLGYQEAGPARRPGLHLLGKRRRGQAAYRHPVLSESRKVHAALRGAARRGRRGLVDP